MACAPARAGSKRLSETEHYPTGFCKELALAVAKAAKLQPKDFTMTGGL